MTWGVLNFAMLAGLAGVALPVIIHLLSRRRDPVIDWGAMQFLELGPWSRRRINLADLLLMLARMLMLALVALALSRPFWTPSKAAPAGLASGSGAGIKRDVVLILDNSGSMGRRLTADTTPATQALTWAKSYIANLTPGDSVAILLAKDRVQPLVDPPSFDRGRLEQAVAKLSPPRGSSDLSAAVGEAFRILEKGTNPASEVIVLTDNQRIAWRPGEPSRWDLLRDLRKRLPIAPRLWSLDFSKTTGTPAEPVPNGSVVSLELSRSTAVPRLPLLVTATVANTGPGPLTRPIELLIDGQLAPGTGQVVGPIPPGGQATVSFRVTLDEPGGHLLTAQLAAADDPMPSDDEASRPIEVTKALPALLVDGEPSLEPLGGETDFLRAALAPSGDDLPQVKATVIPLRAFNHSALQGQKVIVLANVDQLSPEMLADLDLFVAAGGGLLIAPGDKTDPKFAGDAIWLPATIRAIKGDFTKRVVVAHPSPRTFTGPVVGPLGQGDTPPLGEADLFAYRVLTPRDKATVIARLDNGDPWIVERPHGKGRVAMLASAIDAEVGTLPVNPDFVPLAHELVLHLGAGGTQLAAIRPGEPIVFDLPGVSVPTDTTLPLLTPDGKTTRVKATKFDTSTQVKYTDTSDPGVYRLTRPNPPGGFSYALVATDPRESDPAPLESAEATKLSEGWPLAFEADATKLASRIAEGGGSPRHEIWRTLVLAALGGLCLEVWMTRRMAKTRGLA